MQFINFKSRVNCLFFVSCLVPILSHGAESANEVSISEYSTKVQQLNYLEQDILSMEAKIEGLVKAKKRAETRAEKAEVISTLKKEYEELSKKKSEFNELREEVKYRFPEKERTIETRYLPMKEETLDEMEHASGLDRNLTRVRRRIRKKYESFLPEEEKQPSVEEIKNENKKKPEKIRLVR